MNSGLAGLAGTNAVVPVLVTSTLLLAARGRSSRVQIRNLDAANPVYVSYANPALSGTVAGAGYIVKAGEILPLVCCSALYAIATGGTVNVAVITDESIDTAG